MDLIVTAFTDPALLAIGACVLTPIIWAIFQIFWVPEGRPVLPATDTENRPTVTVEGID